jgi:hypothetical protein
MFNCTANITIGDKTVHIISTDKSQDYTFDNMLENVEILKQKTDAYLQTILDQNKNLAQVKEEEPEDEN